MRPAWRLAVAGAWLFTAFPATAQPMQEARGAPTGAFDFYVLALSWSPGFCEVGARGSERKQCEDGNGLGFVIHGLWPQSDRGYPTFCEPQGRFVPRAVIDQIDGLYPDSNLARYQWRKHGTCSGVSPSEYFALVRKARDRVQIPDGLKGPQAETHVMPIEIERAFANANPGLRPEMMSVSCGRRVFQEIRICLDKDLRGFRQCPEVNEDGCRAGQIAVPAPR
ncbi:ribonuclease T2 [Microvirga rosea]|uniref:ribonuclease T2 n=1 Tax=Microvirga rosea TaxID=2715425 RepID=UPI001D0ABF6F|nr:ribonuclease T2 [Microvirga rosea]MCB8821586.1 ribonuclease T2 [Microvirga rosea]